MDETFSNGWVPRNSGAAAALRGAKLPHLHRVFLVDGRVLQGELHRMPNARLADHLSTLRGVLSLTNALCEKTREEFPYVVVMLHSVLFIQEIGPVESR